VRGRLAPQQHGSSDGRYCREEQVHVQAPAPGQVLRQHAAEQQADRAADPRDRAEHAKRLPSVLGAAESGGQDRERGGSQQRTEQALAGPCPDEHAEAGRGAASCRGGREAEQSDQEGHLAPEQAGEPAAEQQQAAGGESVGSHDPLPVHIGEVQRLLGRRQRDVHATMDDVARRAGVGVGDRLPAVPGQGGARRGPVRGANSGRGCPGRVGSR
jgi:hypothetical protein